MTISLNSLLTEEASNVENTNKKPTDENCSQMQLDDFQKEINWDELVDSTFQPYLESGIGRLIIPTETMLKVYFLQHRYGMLASDTEKALCEIDGLKEFAVITDVIPKASNIRAFANLLREKKLSTKIEKAFTVSS